MGKRIEQYKQIQCGGKKGIGPNEIIKILTKGRLIFVDPKNAFLARVVDCAENHPEQIRCRREVVIEWEYGGWEGKRDTIPLSSVFLSYDHVAKPKREPERFKPYDFLDNKRCKNKCKKFSGIPCDKYGCLINKDKAANDDSKKITSTNEDVDDCTECDQNFLKELDEDLNLEYSVFSEDQDEISQSSSQIQNYNTKVSSKLKYPLLFLKNISILILSPTQTFFAVEKICEVRCLKNLIIEYGVKWLGLSYGIHKWVTYEKLHLNSRAAAREVLARYGYVDRTCDFENLLLCKSWIDLSRWRFNVRTQGKSGLVAVSYSHIGGKSPHLVKEKPRSKSHIEF